MKRKYDVTAIIGKYIDKDGKEKNRYLTCGAVLERDDGSLCMKLDCTPVISEGWFSFYAPKVKEDAPPTMTPTAPKPAPTKTEVYNDEIPF